MILICGAVVVIIVAGLVTHWLNTRENERWAAEQRRRYTPRVPSGRSSSGYSQPDYQPPAYVSHYDSTSQHIHHVA